MTKTYAKIEDGVLITTCAPEEDADLIAQLMSDGFKPYDESAPQPQAEGLQALVPFTAIRERQSYSNGRSKRTAPTKSRPRSSV